MGIRFCNADFNSCDLLYRCCLNYKILTKNGKTARQEELLEARELELMGINWCSFQAARPFYSPQNRSIHFYHWSEQTDPLSTAVRTDPSISTTDQNRLIPFLQPSEQIHPFLPLIRTDWSPFYSRQNRWIPFYRPIDSFPQFVRTDWSISTVDHNRLIPFYSWSKQIYSIYVQRPTRETLRISSYNQWYWMITSNSRSGLIDLFQQMIYKGLNPFNGWYEQNFLPHVMDKRLIPFNC
jgi:hypothetical protein